MVSDSPRLRLGLWEEGEEVFEGIRAARHLSSSRIGVADGTTKSVRVFNLAGELVEEIGRDGDGPGEFRRVDHISVLRDTVYIVDGLLRRVSFFDVSGEYLGQVRLPQDLAGRKNVVGIFENGDFLLERSEARPRAVEKEGPLPADSVTWFRAPPSFARAPALVTAVAKETYGHPWSGGFALGEVIFGTRAHATVDANTLLLARGGDRFEVEVVDREGRIVDRFGLLQASREPSEADRSGYMEWRLENAPGNADTAAWRRLFEDAPMRKAFPATGEILLDPDGNVWVEYFELPDAPQEWAVFDARRVWLGDVEIPQGARVFEVGSDHVLSVHKDSLGVETLVLYDLEKPGKDPP